MSERKRLIAGNWKMFKTRAEAETFAETLRAGWPPQSTAALGATSGLPEAVICAPFTALASLGQALAQSRVRLGAQNLSEHAEGAYTGEISASMLSELGVGYVIVGHSERRAYFAESDAAVAAKTIVALQSGIAPIVCVGESLEEREGERTQAVIAAQLAPVLTSLREYAAAVETPAAALKASATVIAYEPIWAIGTGKSSSAADASAVISFIRAELRAVLGASLADELRIQYGGSVKPENIAQYLAQPDIDGALVGGASLTPESYTALLRQSILS